MTRFFANIFCCQRIADLLVHKPLHSIMVLSWWACSRLIILLIYLTSMSNRQQHTEQYLCIYRTLGYGLCSNGEVESQLKRRK